MQGYSPRGSRVSTLAKAKLTGSSREQLQSNVNVKFMILDQETHFEKICGKTNHPVHLLKREGEGKLRWVKSVGGFNNLCKYMDQEQDELEEGNFCQLCTSKSLPVLICDSPGKGKSVLLAHIGHRLIQLHPKSTVLFIVLSELMNRAKSIGMENKVKLIERTLQYWTGEAIPKPRLNSNEETVSIELLLDGYDEVDSADRKLALEILQTISKSFKCIRLWINSRPHLMNELENSLNVLGYNIRPFYKENQIHFLSSFWSGKAQLDQDKFQLFAKQCLKSLKATISSTDNDIAGIPLQCLLIGEVYEDDATEFAKVDNENRSNAVPEIEVGTITGLYNQLIKKKLEKYKSAFGNAKLNGDYLMAIHAHLSLEELFPVEHGILKLTKAAEIDIDEVMKGGIITSTRMEGVTFIHRTFAEYFVAQFFIDKLQREVEWTPDLLGLFLNVIKMGYFCVNGKETKTICYFLNSMIDNPQIEILPNNLTSKLNDKQLNLVEDIALTCIEANFVHVFNLFNTRGLFDKLSSQIFNADFLLLAATSSVELVKWVLIHFERHYNFDLATQKDILREAVKKGKFSILEFLIKEKQLSGLVKKFDETTNLVCDCVEGTVGSSNEVIKDKILVLQMLVGIHRSLVNGRNSFSNTAPLLSRQVHVKLLIELIRLGAHVLVQDIIGYTVLHLCSFYYYQRRISSQLFREDYHKLVMCIPTDQLKKLVRLEGVSPNRETALMTLLRRFDPLPETLGIFHGVGADFNYVDEEGYSVLTVAIKNGRNAVTLRKLVHLGAQVKSLHFAVKYRNVDVVGLLLDEGIINVNDMDENGWTPLDHSITGIICALSTHDKYKNLQVCLKLLERGGTLPKEIESNRYPWLHIAATKDLESVKLLVQLGLDVNGIDKKGNTPLHLVAQRDRSIHSFSDQYSIVQHLLESGSNPATLNNRNETPFHTFLRDKNGNLKIFRLFKSIWDERSLWTPTIATLALGYVLGGDVFPDKKIEQLIQQFEAHGADFSWRDGQGNSVLHLAALNGKTRIIKFLIKKGVSVNSKNYRGQSPLHMAASSDKNNCLEVIKCLIESRADPINTTYFGENILHFAAKGRADALKYLLERMGGEDVNGKDSYGNTPLHCAVNYRNKSAAVDYPKNCRLLIQYGADVNILNSRRLTPLEMAMEPWTIRTTINC